MAEPETENQRPGELYRIAWVFYLLLALAGVGWIAFSDAPGNPCGEVKLCLRYFLDPATWYLDLAIGAGAGGLVLLSWEVVRRLVPIAGAMEDRLGTILGDISGDEAITLAVLSGFAEELFFRGAVQGSLGLFLATVLFAAVHTGPGRELKFWTLYAAAAGTVLGGLMAWRGNLLAPVTAHTLVNAVGLWRLSRRSTGGEGPPTC